MFSVLWRICRGVELLGHLLTLCLTFWGTIKLFSTAAAPFFFFYSYHNVWVFQFLYILARVHNRLLTGSYSPVCSLHGRQSGLLSFFLFCPVLSKILEEEERKRNFDQLPPTARVCAWPGINLPPFGVRGDAPTSWATTVRARVVILKFKAKHGTDM